ncbi:MAG: exodeoxyribonuclease VII large subunit [Bacteroidia bacterium]|nr:exodeoxyribonuclease VII large subunit [Bacteroidia bacterium]
MHNAILSVTELTFIVKNAVEGNPKLNNATVSGEISNLNYHSSGHVYFTIKDNSSQLSCTMWKSVAEKMPKLKDGQKAEITGSVEVYIPHGKYQFNVKKVITGGKGNLYEQFLLLKEKLREEGLFDTKFKKNIPPFPVKIGILTSPTGSVLHDMLQIIRKRYPVVKVLIFPTAVQGTAAKNSITENLAKADTFGLDLLILARGGGSIEDLWSFNEEAVARAVFHCKTPVITGIGHETDTTIADFVADVRAETPTAAAMRAVPDREALLETLDVQKHRALKSMLYYIEIKKQTLDNYEQRLTGALKLNLQKQKNTIEQLQSKLFRILPDIIEDYQYDLDRQELHLQQAMLQAIQNRKTQLSDLNNITKTLLADSLNYQKNALGLLETRLQGLDIMQLLKQGYTLTLKNGKVVNSISELKKNDIIATLFSDGSVSSKVEK